MLPEQMVEGQGLLQLAVAVEVLLAQQVQVLVQVHFPPLEGVEEVQGLQVLVVLQQLGEVVVVELQQGGLLLRYLPSDVGRLRQRS